MVDEYDPTAHVDYGNMYDSSTDEASTPDPTSDVDPSIAEVFPGSHLVDEEPEDSPATYVTVNLEAIGAKLNMRENPSLDAGLVTTLPNNTVLLVVDDSNDEWLFVEVDDKRGYVKRAFVTTTAS